jgi:hypothetical protein
VREWRTGAAAREWVCGVEELRVIADGRSVAIAEERVAARLAGCPVEMRALTVGDALPPVLRCLRAGGSDVATVDANYVRGEADIYRKKEAASENNEEAASEHSATRNATGQLETKERADEQENLSGPVR